MSVLVFLAAVYIGWKLRKIQKVLNQLIQDYKR